MTNENPSKYDTFENISLRDIFGVYKDMKDLDKKIYEILEMETPPKFRFPHLMMDYPCNKDTLLELEYLIELIPEREKNLEYIRKADSEVELPFYEFLIDNNKEIPVEEIQSLLQGSVIFLMKLKYFYNRPRPFQVAKIAGIDFSALDSKTAHTPAYPSGHSFQALILADFLSSNNFLANFS